MKISGLYTAMITPFLGEEIDQEGFINNIHYQSENQVDGLVILGTTGEAPTLNDNEKKQIIKLAREHYTGPLIVGTGSYSTAVTLDNCLKAQDLGADALLIIAPYYNKPTQEGLLTHYEFIAGKTCLPIIVYNALGRTSVNIEVNTILKLAQIQNIIGIKECSSELQQFTEILLEIKSLRKDFGVLTGDDVNTFSSVLLGGDGVISVASNLIPKKMRYLVDALKNNDVETARSLHFELYHFFKAAFIETNPIPIKEAMSLCEMPAGPCRSPLSPIQEKNRIKLIAALEQLQLKPIYCKT